ncbi:MAG TPA: hypothetical protein VF278_03475 [Pirellulales bacterium]
MDAWSVQDRGHGKSMDRIAMTFFLRRLWMDDAFRRPLIFFSPRHLLRRDTPRMMDNSTE